MKNIFKGFGIMALSILALSSCTNDSNVIKVGIDLKFPPFSYLDDGGKPAGFEPDIAIEFGEYLGKEVEIVNIDFSLLIPALDIGDVDVLIADMSETEERAVKADFSKPYRYGHTLALMNKDFALENGITDDMTEEDFFAIKDAKFVGLAGTKGVYYPEQFGVEVTEVTEISTALFQIDNGDADVLVASDEIHQFHANYENTTVVYSGIKEQSASSFVVKKGNSELLDKCDTFIDSMYEEGGFYDTIRSKYDPIIADFLKNDELGLDYIIYKDA